MAEIGDERISSATFFTTQVDFTDAGDLKVFVDAEQLKTIERKMAETGYLEGAHMANAFNMLRPNDLIWSYFVNNYLKGKEPMPFDLLVWNADSTRMPAANHRFYLRHCYLQNDLTQGPHDDRGQTHRPVQGDDPGLRTGRRAKTISRRRNRSSPAPSSSAGRCATCSPARAISPGVVNPADKPKYQYWTGGPPERRLRRLARRRHGEPRLVVARLDRMDQGAGARTSSRHASRARAS